ncbi:MULTISPECIES: hypothetical protein [Pseudomonas]|jgi:hypothetical protein|uniref:Uncharacterized protein n=1 Tax=Pseudomonas fluorescens TaxID=294 RepID=A0A5E7NYB7_PSEFL|nr:MULTISPECIES: hypothetical protein [Pseudomonas]VVP42525.1 hypothetical protein PS854_04897 [Pseudomonas fluorescens]
MFETPIDFPALEQRLAFLGLTAAAPVTARLQTVTLPLSQPAPVRAAIAGSSIVSVAEGVSADDEQDALDCALYLEQYTDTRYDRQTQWYEWLQHFTLGLWHFGWIHQRPVMLDSRHIELHEPISSAILETLRPNVSDSLYSAAMYAFEALKDNLQASMLLAQKSAMERGRQFQTMPCAYDANGRLTLMLIHSWYVAAVNPAQFLFLKWLDHDVTLIQHYGTFTLDRKRFDPLAAAMRDKITERSREYLLRL